MYLQRMNEYNEKNQEEEKKHIKTNAEKNRRFD